jgi:hypothetical protein
MRTTLLAPFNFFLAYRLGLGSRVMRIMIFASPLSSSCPLIPPISFRYFSPSRFFQGHFQFKLYAEALFVLRFNLLVRASFPAFFYFRQQTNIKSISISLCCFPEHNRRALFAFVRSNWSLSLQEFYTLKNFYDTTKFWNLS